MNAQRTEVVLILVIKERAIPISMQKIAAIACLNPSHKGKGDSSISAAGSPRLTVLILVIKERVIPNKKNETKNKKKVLILVIKERVIPEKYSYDGYRYGVLILVIKERVIPRRLRSGLRPETS